MPFALEDWYAQQSDGDWEHLYGVKITTLDNPGWSVSVALNETDKQDVPLARTKIDRSDEDWIHYWVAENRYEIRCGPRNLSEAVQLFVDWFNSN